MDLNKLKQLVTDLEDFCIENEIPLLIATIPEGALYQETSVIHQVRTSMFCSRGQVLAAIVGFLSKLDENAREVMLDYLHQGFYKDAIIYAPDVIDTLLDYD